MLNSSKAEPHSHHTNLRAGWPLTQLVASMPSKNTVARMKAMQSTQSVQPVNPPPVRPAGLWGPAQPGPGAPPQLQPVPRPHALPWHLQQWQQNMSHQLHSVNSMLQIATLNLGQRDQQLRSCQEQLLRYQAAEDESRRRLQAELSKGAAQVAAVSDAAPPPPLLQLGPQYIFNHLALSALEPAAAAAGATAAASAAPLAHIAREHRGVSLSTYDLSFKPAVPGEVAELPLRVINSHPLPIHIKAASFFGPCDDPPPFSIAAPAESMAAVPAVPDDATCGALVPSGEEHGLTVRLDAPDERGAKTQWLFVRRDECCSLMSAH